MKKSLISEQTQTLIELISQHYQYHYQRSIEPENIKL